MKFNTISPEVAAHININQEVFENADEIIQQILVRQAQEIIKIKERYEMSISQEIVSEISIFRIDNEFADVWVAADGHKDVKYLYGGTRMVNPTVSYLEIMNILQKLMRYESSLKNSLINKALEANILGKYKDSLPKGFENSKPKNQELYAILTNPTNPSFTQTIESIFVELGKLLDNKNGKIKLTPDFGRFSGVADILAKFTPHVLGVCCENGGCGGKSSYSSNGVIAAIEEICPGNKEIAITLIGSA
ncbi:11946_t:CDS:2, partial [Racocetra persica]